MKIKKELLDNAPVADPFSDISEERKAELKKQADEEWETYHSVTDCSRCVYYWYSQCSNPGTCMGIVAQKTVVIQID